MDLEKDTRRVAYMQKDKVTDTGSFLYGRPSVKKKQDEWSPTKYAESISMKFIQMNEIEMEFDIIGIDPGLVNAFRRILLSEVPSMAFEKIGIYNNTSVIPDEVLAHRLGLIPLKADPMPFAYRPEGAEGKQTDTLFYKLYIECKWNPNYIPGESADQDDMYVNHKVYSSHIKWLPVGDGNAQKDFYDAESVGPLYPDILIAKLRPGHVIDLVLEAVKGVGKDHAKFSPVAPAFYRLLPQITIKKPITGEAATRFQKCFSDGVIAVDEVNGEKVARVVDARYDSCSRNVLRYDDLAEKVDLGRVKDHHIFTIESCTGRTPDALFLEAIDVLKAKAKKFLAELNKDL